MEKTVQELHCLPQTQHAMTAAFNGYALLINMLLCYGTIRLRLNRANLTRDDTAERPKTCGTRKKTVSSAAVVVRKSTFQGKLAMILDP